MELVESERLEFKSKVTERICRTIIAFANGAGGRLLVGIDDLGRAIGIDDIDAEMLRLSNLISDRICPELMQFVEIEPLELDGKRIICIDVESGDEKPYYLADKGLCPKGVFVRLGPATVPLDRRGIRKMIRDADRCSFEAEQCGKQDLSFVTAERVFARHGWEFESPLLETLGIKTIDGFYTNLALLISDDNPFDIKCAAFNDDAYTELLDREFCTGSIFSQLEAAEKFLARANCLRSYFPPGELQRIDKNDYPPEAIREGIVNAIVHRDYDDAPGSSTLIKMNRTNLRFISFGGLFEIDAEQAVSGISRSRNPHLQNLFLRLGIIESLGTGLPSVYELYEPEQLKPEFKASPNTVELVLPNLNTTRNENLSARRNDGPSLRGGYEDYLALEKQGALPPDVERAFQNVKAKRQEAKVRTETSDARSYAQNHLADMGIAIESCARPISGATADGRRIERTLIKLAAAKGGAFTRKEAESVTGAGRDVTLKIINGMVENGKLAKEGRARATRYRVVTA